jgi:ribosomal protein S18 acetylase RimI-like enzyme
MTDFTIRPATADDAATLAHTHVQGWRDSGAGTVDPVYLGSLGATEERDLQSKWPGWLQDPQSRALIAFNSVGEAAGFIYFGRVRTPIPGQSPIRPLYTGEIYALYILPAFHRQGLGRRLLRAAAEELATMKHKSLCLWVLEGNRRAVDFYKAVGGQRCGKKETDLGGGKYQDICMGWRSTDVLRT